MLAVLLSACFLRHQFSRKIIKAVVISPDIAVKIHLTDVNTLLLIMPDAWIAVFHFTNPS
jgi:hypothetical protein